MENKTTIFIYILITIIITAIVVYYITTKYLSDNKQINVDPSLVPLSSIQGDISGLNSPSGLDGVQRSLSSINTQVNNLTGNSSLLVGMNNLLNGPSGLVSSNSKLDSHTGTLSTIQDAVSGLNGPSGFSGVQSSLTGINTQVNNLISPSSLLVAINNLLNEQSGMGSANSRLNSLMGGINITALNYSIPVGFPAPNQFPSGADLPITIPDINTAGFNQAQYITIILNAYLFIPLASAPTIVTLDIFPNNLPSFTIGTLGGHYNFAPGYTDSTFTPYKQITIWNGIHYNRNTLSIGLKLRCPTNSWSNSNDGKPIPIKGYINWITSQTIYQGL